MAVKIEFHPSVANDVKELKINPVQFSQIREKILAASEDVDSNASRIRGLPPQFRKIKFADKRIVVWKSKGVFYVLKIFHRRQGYSKESLQRLMELVKEYAG